LCVPTTSFPAIPPSFPSIIIFMRPTHLLSFPYFLLGRHHPFLPFLPFTAPPSPIQSNTNQPPSP
jgi:hypothetical protein